MSKIRILSLDGGGIRGIIPATILSYIEDKLKEKSGNSNASIAEYFDFIAGTSSGGILSLLYLCPDENGKPKYSAREALELFKDRGDEIFKVSILHKIRNLNGIIDEKYPEKPLEKLLKTYLSETLLSQSLKPCLIPSYDIRNRKAFFFTSLEAKQEERNYYMREVARATAAAPTYFEPTQIKSMGGTSHPLIDGGIFANNPALCAYAEARKIDFKKMYGKSSKPNKPTAKDMIIVSIGSGDVKEPYYYKDFKDAGVFQWVKPLIDMMMSGNSETVDYQLRKIYETLEKKDQPDYHRIQPNLVNADNSIDNATSENLNALHRDGLLTIAENKKELSRIIDKLIENQ